MAGVTGLEPATSGVTGQRSNQLSYTPLNLRYCRCYLPNPYKSTESFTFLLLQISFTELINDIILI